jgi:glutamine amidotransferase
MKKITIIDYGLGNIKSVQRAFEVSGADVMVTSSYQDISKSEKLILPGVGTFRDGMLGLQKLKLIDSILDFVNKEKPILGICLGMQLMLNSSNEFGINTGLGLINGKVIQIPNESLESKIIRKVPHVGWNKLKINKKDSFVLNEVSRDDYFYFVHSFIAVLDDTKDLLTSSDYEGFEFVSGINKNNIYGLQFHPEKSGKKGLQIIKNFISL